MTGADCLVLLSDIDGLYTADPRRDPTPSFISRVLDITPAIEAMAAAPARFRDGAACRPRSPPPRSPWGGLSSVHRQGRDPHPSEAHRGRRALHLVPARHRRRPRRASSGSRELWAGRGDQRRRGRGACAVAGQEPLAGRRHARRRPVRPRRYGEHRRARQPSRSRARHLRLLGRRCRAHPGAQVRGDREFLGFRGRDEIVHRDDLVLDGD